ncbi:MAG: hypothetical protein P4L45_16000 [Ignavibacteriaceae bacterium]|nr:hypothetical protein [Ignavibacteriaceae bacterium]
MYNKVLYGVATKKVGSFQYEELVDALEIRLLKYDELKDTLIEMVKQFTLTDKDKTVSNGNQK